MSTSSSGFSIYLATVQSVDTVNNKVDIRIPALMGTQVVTIDSPGGAFSPPPTGANRVIAVNDDRTQFLWVTVAGLGDGVVEANNISAGAITAGAIAADAITAYHIAAGTITADELNANAIMSEDYDYDGGSNAPFSVEGSFLDLETGTFTTPGLFVDGETGDVAVRGDITAESLSILESGSEAATFGSTTFGGWTGFGLQRVKASWPDPDIKSGYRMYDDATPQASSQIYALGATTERSDSTVSTNTGIATGSTYGTVVVGSNTMGAGYIHSASNIINASARLESFRGGTSNTSGFIRVSTPLSGDTFIDLEAPSIIFTTPTLLHNGQTIPQGFKGSALGPASDQSVSTLTDITGCSVSFAAVSGRRYLVNVSGNLQKTVTDDFCAWQITDGSGGIYNQYSCGPNGTIGTIHSVGAGIIITPSTGTATVKVRMTPTTGNVVAVGSFSRRWTICVTDVG